jgi:hypothetical protein
MILRHASCSRLEMLFQVAILLFLWTIPANQAFVAHSTNSRPAGSQPMQLRVAEQVVTMQRHTDSNSHADVKRSSRECGQERLESVLRSCEAAAGSSTPLPAATTSDGNIPMTGPLMFCGASCNHLVIAYANECSQNEFLVNVSGACKLRGTNMTVECVFAVVLVKMGITSCIKMVADVESAHEIVGIQPDSLQSREFVEEQCCSLETSYESTVMHDVYADSMGRPMIEPALEPPWVRTNATDYQAVLDVVSSELCLIPLPVPTDPPTTTNEQLQTSSGEPDSDSTSNTVGSRDEAVSSSVLWRNRLSLSLCSLFVSLSVALL